MEFKEFNLHPDLQRGIEAAGYTTCMPVQEQVLQNAFGGNDLYVQSQTGTGKTAAFLTVIYQRLLSEPLLKSKKALIMAPTRELAVQIEDEAKTLGQYLPFKTGSFYGGVGYGEQQRALRNGVQIMVGTPGRVLDLNASGQMNLMDIAFLVLDEADRMFDMGFYPDLRKLIRVVPPADRRQTMLFSATLNNYVKNLAWEYTKSPVEIEIAPEQVTVEEIEQTLYHVPSDDKFKLLMGILEREKPESAIVFCNTKRYAEIVAKRLRVNGIHCEFIMGDLPQVKRLKIIDDVKAGKTHFLVATDVAARGLDIDDLAMVVNYDLPNEAENYVHRIGRTARAGKSGRAVTLASEQDVYELPAIERYIGKKIPSQIAVPEDYGEDKSDGMRIRTDDYGEHRGGREGSRSRTSSAARPPRRRESVPRRQGSEGKKTGGKAGFAGKAGLASIPRSGTQTKGPARKDLSAMSYEERMAYYRGKYQGEASVSRPGAGPESKRQGQKQARNKGAAAKPSRKPQSPLPAAQTAAKKEPEAKAAKPGLLGRLLGLFKKEPTARQAQ